MLEAAAKLLKAYKDELPEGALQILAKASGLPEPQPAAKSHTKEEGAGEETKKEGAPWTVLSKEALEKMDSATQPLSSSSWRRTLPPKPRPERPGSLPRS